MADFTPTEYIAARAPKYAIDARTPTLLLMNEDAFGAEMEPQRNQAIALLTLHQLTMDDRDPNIQGAGGMISSVQEGSLRMQFLQDFTLSSTQSSLSQTRWGMELISLKKSNICAPRTRFCF